MWHCRARCGGRPSHHAVTGQDLMALVLPEPDFHRLDRASFAWRTRIDTKSVSSDQYAASRVSRKPNGHSRVKFFIPGKGIKPQPEAVEVMVADGSGGTPCGELSQRPQFGDTCLDRAPIVGGERNRPAHRHPAQGVFAKSECE